MKRWLATLWGLFPFARVKGRLLWALGPRFLVGVMAVVFDGDGRIMMFRHTHDRRRPWGLPSGRVEGRESLDAALRRELLEESGFEVRVGPIVGAYRELEMPMVRVAYLCEIAGGSFRPSAEVDECRFLALGELPANLRATQRAAIGDAQRVKSLYGEMVDEGSG